MVAVEANSQVTVCFPNISGSAEFASNRVYKIGENTIKISGGFVQGFMAVVHMVQLDILIIDGGSCGTIGMRIDLTCAMN